MKILTFSMCHWAEKTQFLIPTFQIMRIDIWVISEVQNYVQKIVVQNYVQKIVTRWCDSRDVTIMNDFIDSY